MDEYWMGSSAELTHKICGDTEFVLAVIHKRRELRPEKMAR
jgi:hypothetical protein